MNVGVKLEGAAPGMKDAEETGEIPTDVMFIRGDFFNSLGGGLEQGRVSHPLVFSNEAAQILRDGKGEQEMVTGELPLHLLFEPLPGFMVLTGRAMTITTGAMDPMELAALLTLIQGDPADFGTTSDDGIDDLAV